MTESQLRLYNNGFITTKDNAKIYVYCKNKISRKTLVCSIDIYGHLEIQNRDALNVFIESNYNKDLTNTELESLSNEEIKSYLISIIEKDIVSLVKFDVRNNKILAEQLSKFPKRLHTNLIKYINDFGISESPSVIIDSELLINILEKYGFYYLYFNPVELKYRLASTNSKNVACRIGYNKWSKVIENNDCILFFFNKRDNYESVKAQLESDLKLSCYAPAERFMKLEDTLTKTFDNAIEKFVEQNDFIDASSIIRVNLEDDMENLTSLVRSYKTEPDTLKRSTIFSQLENIYHTVYRKLDESKDSLKRLCAKL